MTFILLIALTCLQAEWPQWGGASRDFFVEADIHEIDHKKPLTLLRKHPVGEGYSGLVISGDRIVSQSRKGDTEFVFACDIETGKEIWRHEYHALALEFMIPGHGFGPHSTACISGELVCADGGTGTVNVIDFSHRLRAKCS